MAKTKNLGRWMLCFTVFNKQKGFTRQNKETNEPEIIILLEKDETVSLEKPLYFPGVSFSEKTPEVMMFKIDLLLMEQGHNLEEPFMFPDDFGNLYQQSEV